MIVAVLMVSAFLPTIGVSVFPVHLDSHGAYTTDLATTWKGDPVAGIVTFFRPPALAFWAGIWVALLAFTILVIATNAGLIGISRLSYSMANHDLFPKVFARLHPRYRTPYVSIIVFGVVAGLLIIPAQIDLMASVYSLAATFAFAVAHLAVMRLRFVEPDLPRPYTMPLNIRLGRSSLPVLSIVGALAIGAVFTQLVVQNVGNSTYVYAGWLGLGLITYVAYRGYRRKPVWDPLARPRPAYPAVAAPIPPAIVPAEPRFRVPRSRGATLPISAAPTAIIQPAPTGRVATGRLLRTVVRALPATAAAGGLSVAAVAFDLSRLDPTGPQISWSIGVVMVIVTSAYVMVRTQAEP